MVAEALHHLVLSFMDEAADESAVLPEELMQMHGHVVLVGNPQLVPVRLQEALRVLNDAGMQG